MNLAFVTEAKEVNEKLEKKYGCHTVKNQANFRIVFAGDQLETRKGNFEVFTDSGIYLRTDFNCVRTVPKYPQFPENSWVLERLVANLHTDVMDGDYVYEPVYNYKEGMFPIWRACEFTVEQLFVKKQPHTQKEAEYRDAEKKAKEVAYIKNAIDATGLRTALHDGEALSFSNKDGIDYRPSAQVTNE